MEIAGNLRLNNFRNMRVKLQTRLSSANIFRLEKKMSGDESWRVKEEKKVKLTFPPCAHWLLLCALLSVINSSQKRWKSHKKANCRLSASEQFLAAFFSAICWWCWCEAREWTCRDAENAKTVCERGKNDGKLLDTRDDDDDRCLVSGSVSLSRGESVTWGEKLVESSRELVECDNFYLFCYIEFD